MGAGAPASKSEAETVERAASPLPANGDDRLGALLASLRCVPMTRVPTRVANGRVLPAKERDWQRVLTEGFSVLRLGRSARLPSPD